MKLCASIKLAALFVVGNSKPCVELSLNPGAPSSAGCHV